MKSARMGGNGARLGSVAFAMFVIIAAAFEVILRR